MADQNPKIDVIKQVVSHLTTSPFQLTSETVDDGLQLTLEVDEADSGALIGYHGEKIDALQLISSLIWNQNSVVYAPVQVDINGYRQRRRVALEDLAQKAATKAIESGREILLPHLPSYERRVIHMYLQNQTEVTTYSEGEGQDRRLVVRPNSETTE